MDLHGNFRGRLNCQGVYIELNAIEFYSPSGELLNPKIVKADGASIDMADTDRFRGFVCQNHHSSDYCLGKDANHS